MSGELLVRLTAYPTMRDALKALPHKMLALSSETEAAPIDLEAEQLAGRVERVVSRIQKATFTGKGDAEVVPGLYKDYVKRIAETLQTTMIGFVAGEGVRDKSPMPTDASAEADFPCE